MYIVHRERVLLIFVSFVCFCICNYYSQLILFSYLPPQRIIPTILDVAPPVSFLFYPSPHPRFLLLADRGETLVEIELTRYLSASGQEGSRAEKTREKEVFLVFLFGGRALKKEGGARWGIGKGRKREKGKKSEQNE